MFGYIGENSTPGGGHTDGDGANKLGYLFGLKGVWLPKSNKGYFAAQRHWQTIDPRRAAQKPGIQKRPRGRLSL